MSGASFSASELTDGYRPRRSGVTGRVTRGGCRAYAARYGRGFAPGNPRCDREMARFDGSGMAMKLPRLDPSEVLGFETLPRVATGFHRDATLGGLGMPRMACLE